MAIQKIAGNIGTYVGNISPNQVAASKTVISVPVATATHMIVPSIASGSIKPSIYEGETWATANRLLAQDAGVSVVSGVNNIPIPPTLMVDSSTYWICGINNTSGAITYLTGSGLGFAYKAGVDYTTWTAPEQPGAGYGTLNVSFRFEVWGWIPPEITSIDTDDIICPSQSGINLVCTNAMYNQASSKLFLSDNSTYGEGTMVEQTINSWDDELINFDLVQGSLVPGTNYAYILTDIGQYNTTGFEITITQDIYAFVTDGTGKRSRGFRVC